MAEKFVNRLANSIPDEDCFDIKGVAAELGIGIQRTRQIMNEALTSGRIQNLTKMVGPKKLYAPQMVERLRELYLSNSIVKRRKRNQFSKSALAAAEMVLEIPLFDKDAINIMMTKYGDKEQLVKRIQTFLSAEYAPEKQKLAEMEARHQRERETLLRGHVATNNSTDGHGRGSDGTK